MDIGKKVRVVDVPEPIPEKQVFDPAKVPQREPVPVRRKEREREKELVPV